MGAATGRSLYHVDKKADSMQPCWTCIAACTGVHQCIEGCILLNIGICISASKKMLNFNGLDSVLFQRVWFCLFEYDLPSNTSE